VKATLWYAVSNIAQKGISFLAIPIYIRLLTTTEYGIYSVFMSWKELLLIFVTLNLYCGIFTKAMVQYDKEKDGFASSMLGLSTTTTVLFFLLFLISPNYWEQMLEMDHYTMMVLFLYFITYPAYTFWAVRQRVEYNYEKMVFVALFIAILIPIVSIYLLYATNLRELAIIQGYLGIYIGFGAYFYLQIIIKGKKFFDKKYWSYALRFNLPLIPHYLSLIVLGLSDRIMIQKMCSSAEAGIYSLAYQVSMLMGIFTGAVNNSLVPWLYQKIKVQDYPSISTVSNQLILVVGVMTFGVILISPEFIKILGTNEYYGAIWIVPAVALGVYFSFCYNLFSSVTFYHNATHLIMLASVCGALLNVVLNFIFIRLFGYIAAGYTTLLSYIALMILHYLIMKRVCKINEISSRVFDVGFIGLVSITLLILMFLCLYLFKFTIQRYVFIVILLLIGLKNRKFLERIFTVLK
jgi:O-antigen/teichoic acid export membrane protein